MKIAYNHDMVVSKKWSSFAFLLSIWNGPSYGFVFNPIDSLSHDVSSKRRLDLRDGVGSV